MNTVDDALVWLGHLLQPLGLATTSDDGVRRLLEILGWSVPAVPQCVRNLGGPLAGLLDSLATLLVTRMEVESCDAPQSSVVAPALAVAGALAGVLAAVRALPPLLRSELGAAWVDLTAIDIEFEPRLLGWLIESELRQSGALLHALLAAVGVLERTPIGANPTRHQPAYTRITLRPERLVDVFRSPGDLAGELYGWRTSEVDESRLLGCLFSLGVALGAPGEFRRPTAALSRVFSPTAPVESTCPRAELWLPLIRTDLVGVELIVQIVPATAAGQPEGLALSLVPYGDVAGALDLGEGLTLTLEASTAFANGLAVVLRPLVAPALHPRDSTSAGAATTGTLALVLGGRSASAGSAVVELTAAGVGVSLCAKSQLSSAPRLEARHRARSRRYASTAVSCDSPALPRMGGVGSSPASCRVGALPCRCRRRCGGQGEGCRSPAVAGSRSSRRSIGRSVRCDWVRSVLSSN